MKVLLLSLTAIFALEKRSLKFRTNALLWVFLHGDVVVLASLFFYSNV